MRHILDTNVISELVSKRPNLQVIQWVDKQDTSSAYLSAITIGEIKRGIEKLPECARRSQLAAWLEQDLQDRFRRNILPIDAAVMLTWGALVAKLEKMGRTLPAMDSLISAQAIHFKCALVTRNERDFADCGIVVINPWNSPTT